jgi:hypothetical protein
MAAQTIQLPWTTDTELDWRYVVVWGMAGLRQVNEVREQVVLDKEIMVVVSTIEKYHTGCVMSWKACMPPMFATYDVHFKINMLGAWDPDTDLKFELTTLGDVGVLQFKAPLKAEVIARFHAGGKDRADAKGYEEVCSDAYVIGEGMEVWHIVNYTYPGGERRRFNVTYKFDGADKHMMFRCSNGSRMAVFLDTVLGTDIGGTVHDKIVHPERYAPAATRRVRARTTTTTVDVAAAAIV